MQLPTYKDNVAVSVRENDEWEAERIVQIEERFQSLALVMTKRR